MVLMTPVGAGIHGSIYHSHSFDAQATRIPGWKIVHAVEPARRLRPACCRAIADPNPVMVLLPKALMRVKAPRRRGHIPGEPEDAEASCSR